MTIVFEWPLLMIQFVISLIGVVIVVWGVIKATILLSPIFYGKKNSDISLSKNARLLLAEYTLLALDFMVASDVIYTVLAHNDKSLFVLVGLVIIRTVLSYSLDRELKGAV